MTLKLIIAPRTKMGILPDEESEKCEKGTAFFAKQTNKLDNSSKGKAKDGVANGVSEENEADILNAEGTSHVALSERH